MDGNKDEALKCLQIARNALRAGDSPRALKLIAKARRLDPSLPVDDLLKDTANGSKDSKVPATSGLSSSASYTEEQITIVREIRRKKDYYDILGVEKSSSVEDVRKAYRKLSLKVHPDKNQAPGAEEAFKSVSKAFQCLSDEENRKRYDLVGSDEPQAPRRRRDHGFHDVEVDAQEIFRNFFFGGMNMNMNVNPQHTHFYSFGSGPAGARTTNGGSNIRALIQLLPVLFIVLLQFLPSSDPVYSLSRSYQYEHRFTTDKGVPFFVKTDKFEEVYPRNAPERAALEGQIEKEYFSILSQNCQHELQRLQWGFIRETPNCDALKRFQAVA